MRRAEITAENEQEVIDAIVKITSYAEVGFEIIDDLIYEESSSSFDGIKKGPLNTDTACNNGSKTGKGFDLDELWDNSSSYLRTFNNCKLDGLIYNGSGEIKTSISDTKETLLLKLSNLKISNDKSAATFNGNTNFESTWSGNVETNSGTVSYTWKHTGIEDFETTIDIEHTGEIEEIGERKFNEKHENTYLIAFEDKVYKILDREGFDNDSTTFYHPDYGRFDIELGYDFCYDLDNNIDLEQIFSRKNTSLIINDKKIENAFEVCE